MQVLLISMPFASAGSASMGLSTLKSSLLANGIPCDVQYLNFAFRDYVMDSTAYDSIADYWLLGEWVFGEALFGRAWALSKRGGTELLSSFIATYKMENREKTLNSLMEFRYAATSFLDRCIDTLPWEQYGIIGFTSVFSQQIASLALAKRLKERYPEKIIAFGGANCEGEMGQALLTKFPFVDWVFSGEADISLPQAISQWREGKPPQGITGVSYRQEGKIIAQNSGIVLNMDELPCPDLDDYFAAIRKFASDLEGLIPISFEFSRGCWWGAKTQCVFCGLNRQSMNYRFKSAQKALQEIEDLTARYGTRDIRLTDNNLSLSYFQDLLPTLGHPDKKLSSLFVETKVNLNRQQLYTLMMAGTKQLQPGIESLDTEILRYMNKGSTLLQNLRFLKWAREYNLIPAWNLLHSFPGESVEAYQRMADLIPFLVHLQPPLCITPIIIQRFSTIYNERTKWGIKQIQAYGEYHFIYPWEPAELDQFAYRFDYILEDRMSSPDGYLEPVIRELENWQQLWKRTEPPLLILELQEGNHGIIYDTRPLRQEPRTELNVLQTIALSTCDTDLPFSSIAERIKEQMGSAFPGERVLQQEMEHLQQLRFMIREGDRYLSLTNDLKTLAQYGQSMLIKLLYTAKE